MSAQTPDAAPRRLAAPDITARKGGDPVVCLTAYTAPVAAILDEACDLLLVGTRWAWCCTACPTRWASPWR